MKKLANKWPFLVIIILGLFVVLVWPYHDSRVSALDKGVYKDIKTFNEVFDMVKKNYVEDVDSSVLIQGAINGMIKSLDPHSTFMTPTGPSQHVYDAGSIQRVGSGDTRPFWRHWY